MDKVQFAGIPFCVSSPTRAADFLARKAIADKPGFDAHFLNAYSISIAESDSEYRKCITRSAFNFPDGKPISVLSRIKGPSLTQVRGPRLFEDVMNIGRDLKVRHFLLGSSTPTLLRLQAALENRYPGVEIVGSSSPPFRPLLAAEQSAQDDAIRRSDAHIVWVGLGTPKQDFEAARLAAAGFNAVAVGAAFDFSAGTKNVAPEWISRIGLEWFYRLCSEPRRLWRRYLIGNLVFLLAVIREGFGR